MNGTARARSFSALLGALAVLAGCGARNESAAAKVNNEADAVELNESGPERQDTAMLSQADAEKALVALEHEYASALMRRDRTYLERYYAPDWRGGNWMGFWTKSTMLKAVLDERYVVKSMTLTDLTARVYGNMGIVQGVDTEVTTVDGRDTSGRWSFTDIFAWRNGRWVAVASHTAELRPGR
jgi:hypothetical protein